MEGKRNPGKDQYVIKGNNTPHKVVSKPLKSKGICISPVPRTATVAVWYVNSG